MQDTAASSKILIVEDDPLIGEDLKRTLVEFGYGTIGPITKGEEVVEKIKEWSPGLILMDINLAGKIDGIETAMRLQALCSLPLVFLSALSDEATLQRAKIANPFGYLIKPYDPEELRSVISSTLHRFSQGTSLDSEPEVEEHEDLISPKGQTTPSSLKEVLKKFEVLKGLPDIGLSNIAEAAMIREYDGGEFIIFEGDDPTGVFIPITGRISITKTSESGKELIVALLASGDPFGLFYSLPAFCRSSSARTQVPSKIIWIRKAAWLNAVESYPILSHNFCSAIAERLAASYTLSSSLAHSRVEGRIINTLLALLPNFGKHSSASKKEGRIYITRKELAELTGTTPETAIRTTKALERDGLLDLTKPGIIKILNTDTLKSLLTPPSRE